MAQGNYSPGVCTDLARRQFEYVKQHGIKKVFLIARWSLYTDGSYDKGMRGYFLVSHDETRLTRESSRAIFAQAFYSTLDAYRKIGVEVFVVLQVPQQRVQPRNLYLRLYQRQLNGTKEAEREINNQSVDYSKHMQLQQFNRVLIGKSFAGQEDKLIDLDAFFCNPLVCSIGDGDNSYYLDESHLNPNGALRAISTFEKLFK